MENGHSVSLPLNKELDIILSNPECVRESYINREVQRKIKLGVTNFVKKQFPVGGDDIRKLKMS